MKCIFGEDPAAMLGLSGHSAALIKLLKSFLESVQTLRSLLYSGLTEGANVENSCTWESVLKWLIDEREANNGSMCFARAASMSQFDGAAKGVKSENVM
jgi:hypothetical protein